MTNLNFENLNKLADFLEALPAEKFDMEYFRAERASTVSYSVEYESTHKCGTVGCAVGWAPFVEGLAPIEAEFEVEFDWNNPTLNFIAYSRRIFGAEPMDHGGAWDLMFSQEWAGDVNHNNPKATAARIRTVIKGDPSEIEDLLTELSEAAMALEES